MAQSWPPWEVLSLQHNLSVLADLVDLPADHEEFEEAKPWLARLLVVRSCGYVEQVARDTARAYVAEKSGGLVRSFAQSWLERTHSPTPANLLQFVGRFDATLREDLDDFMEQDDQRLRRELSSLVDKRHRIAHGLNEGATERTALAHWRLACDIGDWFILRLNPHTVRFSPLACVPPRNP